MGRDSRSRAKSLNAVVSRFAPSPTGRLHLGHAWSALLAQDFARSRGGRFLLRIEDIDPGRARPEHVEGIFEDLAWLGLAWDGVPILQSRRLPLHAEALGRLRAMGLVYPCFCTRSAIAAEIAASAAAPHGPDGPLYPGTCRRLGSGEREARIAAEPHAWRLDVRKALEYLFPGEGRGPDTPPELGPGFRRGTLAWTDNGIEIDAEPWIFGDVVLARKDAPTSYHLAVTVDDAAQNVTDVVRGRDLFAATHVHRLLQALLGLPTPDYHHHPLLLDAEGRRLAKRHGAPSLQFLREAGADPAELVAALRAGRLPAGYSSAAAAEP
ncbi:MAG: glutamyl-Q tRNA(Asp) synthetase [Sphingomonadales bacterium]|jgi:glutamyl-Q tRNA(Asp) synthetase|nr:glutamyl-Q tRNA(Asp) synthetase [Sphingomonadales bacterium]